MKTKIFLLGLIFILIGCHRGVRSLCHHKQYKDKVKCLKGKYYSRKAYMLFIEQNGYYLQCCGNSFCDPNFCKPKGNE